MCCLICKHDWRLFSLQCIQLTLRGADYQDAFCGVRGAKTCTQMLEVIRLVFLLLITIICQGQLCVVSIRCTRLRYGKLSCKCNCVLSLQGILILVIASFVLVSMCVCAWQSFVDFGPCCHNCSRLLFMRIRMRKRYESKSGRGRECPYRKTHERIFIVNMPNHTVCNGRHCFVQVFNVPLIMV